ncbi:MAG: hypothetical protein LQ342_004554 [Letrouitia transgressa]|nr:MAG: hypothetical protein LQ342_004554 [Letrouitia transgressa]
MLAKKAEIEKLINEAKKTQPARASKPDSRRPRQNAKNGPRPRPKEVSNRTAIIRLPSPKPGTFPTVKHILYDLPPKIPVPKPKQVPNPNSVIVRLPPNGSSVTPAARKPSSKSFCDLPGEIRNRIYDFSFPADTFEIVRVKGTSKVVVELTYLRYKNHQPSTASGPRITPEAARRRRLFDLPRRLRTLEAVPPYELSPGPAALLLTCRKINAEATSIFYSKATFSFQHMRPLRRFLDTLRPCTRSCIRALILSHHTANLPVLVKDNWCKEKNDWHWKDLCWQIACECEGLEALTLHLVIHDKPFMTGPDACWMDPLCAFQDLHFKHCWVTLRHCFPSHDAVMEVEAYKIRKLLMGDNFREPTAADRLEGGTGRGGGRRGGIRVYRQSARPGVIGVQFTQL